MFGSRYGRLKVWRTSAASQDNSVARLLRLDPMVSSSNFPSAKL